ncbi:hypothetical protein BPT24_234 [Tenacibaculum phage pT24]|uniref:DUF4494 domain-containing protein n=1 Tax=Tenacibaculum phage pT24 TaxID=1880590 RepID=A0A1B4XX25_9CAUD|nr:hypothetical protein HYP10_gp294 [Tenacibaculum phage pT24]BAV39354.1 hypothetical protein BPT24_234 [Tenacibaculum phage pT24]
MKYFLVSIAHQVEIPQEDANKDPKIKTKKDKVLVEAENYGDAEKQSYEYAEQHSLKTFSVESITIKNISRVYVDKDSVGENSAYFDVTTKYEYEDDKGKTKVEKSNVVIEASNLDSAYKFCLNEFEDEKIHKLESSVIVDTVLQE